MTNDTKRTIYLVDHDPASGGRLRDLLDVDLFTVQNFIDATSFKAALAELRFGIILLNIKMPDQDDLQLLRHTRLHRLDLPVIALCDQPDMQVAVDVMRGGAEFCLAKPIDHFLLKDALGELSHYNAQAPARMSAKEIETRLTDRQFQVLKLLLAGMQNKRVGVALGISERTVEIHRSKIMRQLNADNFASLIRLATQCGIAPDGN